MNQQSDIEPVTMSDVLGLDTWNRTRSTEELQAFIESHHNSLSEALDS